MIYMPRRVQWCMHYKNLENFYWWLLFTPVSRQETVVSTVSATACKPQGRHSKTAPFCSASMNMLRFSLSAFPDFHFNFLAFGQKRRHFESSAHPHFDSHLWRFFKLASSFIFPSKYHVHMSHFISYFLSNFQKS